MKSFSTLALSGILCTWFLATTFPNASACLHFPEEYPHKLKEGTKRALSFHDGKNAHRVLSTEISVEGDGKLPRKLAYVVPFPSLPIKFEEADAKLFTELHEWFKARWKDVRPVYRDRGMSRAPAPGYSGFTVLPSQSVGNYHITPIRVDDGNLETASAFNEWLTEKKFIPIPLEKQKPYLFPGAVFLAIELNLTGSEASFKPLHVTYKADSLALPLRLTHDSRTFDVDWFVVAPKSHFNTNGYLLTEHGSPFPLSYRGDDVWPLPGDLKQIGPLTAKLLKSFLGENALKNGDFVISRFSASDLNGPGKQLSEISRDPEVFLNKENPPGGAAKEATQ